MLSWVANNIGTIVIGLTLALIVLCIMMGLIKKKREGKSSCGCSCGSCPMSSSCHKH